MDKLPFRRSLAPGYILSLIIAVLVTITTLASIIYREALYPTDALRTGFVATDVGNLLIALPLLLACLWLTRRGKTSALLLWPGALFYILYGYVPYLLVLPFGLLFPAYSLLITFCFFAIVYLISNIDSHSISQRYSSTQVKIIGGALILLATFNLIRTIGLMLIALKNQASVPALEQAMWTVDFTVFSPVLLIGGILIWRSKPLGFATAPALLLAFVALVVGVIPVVIAQANASGLPFPAIDMIVLLIMAVICAVPLLLFFRGNRNAPSKSEL